MIAAAQQSNRNVRTTAHSSLAASKSHLSLKSAISGAIDDAVGRNRTPSDERLTSSQSRLKTKSPEKSVGAPSKRSLKVASSSSRSNQRQLMESQQSQKSRQEMSLFNAYSKHGYLQASSHEKSSKLGGLCRSSLALSSRRKINNN